MKKVILLLFITSFALCGQRYRKEIKMDSTFKITLGPNFTNLICHVVIRAPEKVIYKIDFYKSADSTLLFSFIDSNSVQGYLTYGFKFVDADSDGYKDLSFVTDLSAKSDDFWSVFLFDPKEKKFIYSSKYSDY